LVKRCTEDIAAMDPGAYGRYAIVATVGQVDHQQGLLQLETTLGQIVTMVAPEEVKDLQEGDQILVCIGDTEPAKSLRHDSPRAVP
jgi:hypothetical protein